MRATRALWRRRPQLMRQRAELLSHGQHTTSQDNLPEIGKTIAYKANRAGVAERLHDSAVHKTIEVDLALITDDDARLKELALYILKTAKPQEAHPLYLLQPVPGMGKMLSLVLLYDIHRIDRLPSVQDVASYGRLITCSTEAAGTRVGTSGKKIGSAHLTWAFSEAAVRFLQSNAPGQKFLARVAKNRGTGQALSILAHQLGRAIDDRLTRKTACDRDLFLKSAGSRAGEPDVSLDPKGCACIEHAGYPT